MDPCKDVDRQVYFQTGGSSTIQYFRSPGPTFHGVEVGIMGFRLIWDKATRCILLSELPEDLLCEAHSTKYYRRVVDYYKCKMYLLDYSFAVNMNVNVVPSIVSNVIIV